MTAREIPAHHEIALGLAFCRRHSLPRTRVAFMQPLPYADIVVVLAQEAGVDVAIRWLDEDGQPSWIAAFAVHVPNLTDANRAALIEALAARTGGLKSPLACRLYDDVLAYGAVGAALDRVRDEAPFLTAAQRTRIDELLALLPQ